MFVRKKTKLRIAYGVLSLSAFAVIAHDKHARAHVSFSNKQTQSDPTAAHPLAMTPLAESPFPEARPNRMQANANAPADAESTRVKKRVKPDAVSRVYFLTVAIQVESNAGPVALNRGTRVLYIRQQEGKLLIRHGHTDFLIEKSQVTDDLNALAALARNSS